MTNLKGLVSDFSTPERAQTTLSNIAVGGGVIGFVLMVVGVIIARH